MLELQQGLKIWKIRSGELKNVFRSNDDKEFDKVQVHRTLNLSPCESDPKLRCSFHLVAMGSFPSPL